MLNRQQQWKLLDNFRRKKFISLELKRILLKSFLKNKNMVFINRYYTQYLLTTVPSRYSINVVQNRCVITGRNWNVLKKTQYSRFCFRNESYKGFLPGVKRLSW